MIAGMSMPTFPWFHVLLAWAGIGSGLIVMLGLLTGKRLNGWTGTFLMTTAATSVTGFLFPFHQLLASHILGILSLLVLAGTILARYAFHLAGAWRVIYVVGATVLLYFNVMAAVAQAFLKIPAFKALAPTQKEPPFVVAQLVVLLLFNGLAILAAKRFKINPARAA
jgi:hypothetical protein